MLLNCGVGEDSWESLGLQGDPTSQSWRKSVLNIHWKHWCWSWNSKFWPPDVKNWLIGKGPYTGKDWRQEEKSMTEDEMVGWHHRLDGHEFEQALGVGDGQASLVCCSPWGDRVGHDWVSELNWNELVRRSLYSNTNFKQSIFSLEESFLMGQHCSSWIVTSPNHLETSLSAQL